MSTVFPKITTRSDKALQFWLNYTNLVAQINAQNTTAHAIDYKNVYEALITTMNQQQGDWSDPAVALGNVFEPVGISYLITPQKDNPFYSTIMLKNIHLYFSYTDQQNFVSTNDLFSAISQSITPQIAPNFIIFLPTQKTHLSQGEFYTTFKKIQMLETYTFGASLKPPIVYELIGVGAINTNHARAYIKNMYTSAETHSPWYRLDDLFEPKRTAAGDNSFKVVRSNPNYIDFYDTLAYPQPWKPMVLVYRKKNFEQPSLQKLDQDFQALAQSIKGKN